jgi:hypothetical protein
VSAGPGTRRDHHRFCQLEKWTEVRNARGRKVGHHITYELTLPDGRILRTRISRPPNNETYGARLWAHVLDQLQVTETEFWACVSDRKLPARGAGSDEAPANALPADLVHQLIHSAGVPEAEVATMTLERALEVMREHWSRPRN